jgi:hypothetical protein
MIRLCNCKHSGLVWILSAFSIFLFAGLLVNPSLAEAHDEPISKMAILPMQAQSPSVQYETGTVYIGVWLIDVYNFQYQTGDYTFDFYLYFFWVTSNSNFTQIDWQLVNGYPVTPTSVVLIDRNSTGQVYHEIYRVTARCNTPPDASDYPFDTIKLELIFDLLTRGNFNSEGTQPGEPSLQTNSQS